MMNTLSFYWVSIYYIACFHAAYCRALLQLHHWTRRKETSIAESLSSSFKHQHGDNVSRDAALAIVPPNMVWDRLQRARHYAKDKSYGKWPPCLRLFHPFVSSSSRKEQDDLALCIARVIDKYQISPFDITLSDWSVIPHAEAMESDMRALKMQLSSSGEAITREMLMTEEEKEIQRLIAEQERIGQRNLRERKRRKNIAHPELVDQDQEQPDSQKALWDKQKQMYVP